MEKQEKSNMYEIADAVIAEIAKRKNPFDKITLVFHSAKIAQWFKAYFLKKDKKGTDILMNVEFVTLSSFINDTINLNKENDHVLTAPEYREYLIKALLQTDKFDFPEKAYYLDGNTVNGINLYEFADKLSTVIFNMEFDNEIDDVFGREEASWQRGVYECANKYAEEDGCYTPRKMYLKNKDKFSFSDGNVYVFDNSFITELYKKILSEIGNSVTVYSLGGSSSRGTVELYAAPSKMREVEQLHSDICKQLKDKDTYVNDFVVYAPNINDYANTIHRVFQKNAPGFPEVPFRIVGESKEKHDIIAALDLLFKIANKRFFTRYDLQKYLKNTMVMYKWDIDDDDITAFMQSVEETNTHRNGDGNEDWDYFKKRLLIAMLSDGETKLNGETRSLTYSTIAMDTARINKLVDIIDALSAWANQFTDELSRLMLSENEIGTIIEKMNVLLSIEKGEKEENYLYADVRKEAEKMQRIFSTVPAITFLLLLKDAPGRFSSSPADVFTGGVTFLNLDVDNIVSEKHVYVLGLSSKNFPRAEDKNEIDFSTDHKYTYELDKNAFENLLKSSEKVVVSYQKYDLQTDEEFFPSTVIRGLYNNEKTVPLDESRDIEDLFTSREILSKKRVDNMGTNPEKKKDLIDNRNDDTPRIKTSQIKSYFDNTIVYKYKKILKDSSEDDAARAEEYEIIDIPPLAKHAIIKEMILAGKKAVDEGNRANLDIALDTALERMKLEKKLPKNLEKKYFDTLYNDFAKPVVDILGGKNDYQKVNISPINMTTKSGTKWILETNSLCFVKNSDKNLSFIEPVEQKDKAKSYLTPYVCALAYVAGMDSNIEYAVKLITSFEKEFSVNVDSAKELLNRIFEDMSEMTADRETQKSNTIKYMDIDFIDAICGEMQKNNYSVGNISSEQLEELEKVPTDIENVLKTQNSSWKYFNDKALLDPAVDFGYTDYQNIKSEMFEEYKKISQNILYYQNTQNREENKQ